jgi:WD40 repeat-containing protein SMU1
MYLNEPTTRHGNMNFDGSNGDDDDTESLFPIPSADIIRLILAHLVECGLHDSVRALQQESGIGLAASLQPDAAWWKRQAAAGQWALILQGLSLIDKERAHMDMKLLAAVHEMTILELAELGEWEMAFAMFRCLQRNEEMASSLSELSPSSPQSSSISVSRSLEQKLAHIMAERQKNPQCPVPPDYYGDSGSSSSDRRLARREELGSRLQTSVRIHPPKRLPILLQQAVKWQSYTGQLPMIRKWWEVEEADPSHGDKSTKKRSRHGNKQFDLVMGEISVNSVTVGKNSESALSKISSKDKPISQDYATIKFGKQAHCEAMTFLPDGSGLISGSSDGLVEIWDMDGNLRKDLEYQRRDEVIGHDSGAAISALAVSNDSKLIASGASDGVVNIWRVDTGQCLRTLETSAQQTNGVACLCFSPESSHILIGNSDGICREFGLRTSRVLKEFRGHASYLTACFYHLLPRSSLNSSDEENHHLIVVTASGDGSVRIWDGKTADVLSILKPMTMGNRNLLSTEGSSIVIADLERANQTSNEGSPSIHSILKLHTPKETMILVPRASRAFLVDYSGRIIRLFQDDTSIGGCPEQGVFVAATVNSTNRWLYLVKEDGSCCVFDACSGKLERSIHDFAARSTSASITPNPSAQAIGVLAEVSHMAHHPSKGIVAAFSSSKGQKRGKVTLWK